VASSLELPTDKQVVNKVKQIGKKVIDSASTQETNENKIIEDRYKKFLKFIVREIFINDNNSNDDINSYGIYSSYGSAFDIFDDPFSPTGLLEPTGLV
jgi:hypothetical protein